MAAVSTSINELEIIWQYILALHWFAKYLSVFFSFAIYCSEKLDSHACQTWHPIYDINVKSGSD